MTIQMPKLGSINPSLHSHSDTRTSEGGDCWVLNGNQQMEMINHNW